MVVSGIELGYTDDVMVHMLDIVNCVNKWHCTQILLAVLQLRDLLQLQYILNSNYM